MFTALASIVLAAAGSSNGGAVCSEVCIIQREQVALAELMINERPQWAITLFRNMEDYIACGEKSFAKGAIVAFENFDEIDGRFDRAAAECADDRDAVTAEFLKDGIFTQVDEASANVERTRAMAFAFSMVDKFGSTRRDSAAEKYAESRFPELVAATRDKRNPRPGPAATVPMPVTAPPVSLPPGADPHEGWNLLKPDPFVVENPADAMKWELRGHPESLEGNQNLKMEIQPIPGGVLAVSVIREGLLDDSISATWTYAQLTPRDDGKWAVTMKGEKWRCARSGSDDWGITPCP